MINLYFREIIERICKEEGIKCNIISNGWIIVLEKNGITNYITGYKFGLNSHSLGELLDDKYATYELLSKKGFPVIGHNIVYAQTNHNEYAQGNNTLEYIVKLFYEYNKDVVLKINDGTCGNNVLHVCDEDVLVDSYKKLSSKYFSMSICPFYHVENEYRAIVLNEKVKLIYKKIKPVVVGDGIHSKKELLRKFNYEYFKEIEGDDVDRILELNEIYEYDWRYNLARGAKASLDCNEDIKSSVKELATQVATNIGLKFGSIDIINDVDNQLYIMEINSGVMMEHFIKQVPNGYQIAKEIYSNAIKSYNWKEY